MLEVAAGGGYRVSPPYPHGHGATSLWPCPSDPRGTAPACAGQLALRCLDFPLRLWPERPSFLQALEYIGAQLPQADEHHAQLERQQRQAERLRDALTAATPKQLVFLGAVRADEVAHVLDHADDRHLELFEHRHALGHVLQGDVLWRGDDDHARERDQLRQAQRGIT